MAKEDRVAQLHLSDKVDLCWCCQERNQFLTEGFAGLMKQWDSAERCQAG